MTSMALFLSTSKSKGATTTWCRRIGWKLASVEVDGEWLLLLHNLFARLTFEELNSWLLLIPGVIFLVFTRCNIASSSGDNWGFTTTLPFSFTESFPFSKEIFICRTGERMGDLVPGTWPCTKVISRWSNRINSRMRCSVAFWSAWWRVWSNVSSVPGILRSSEDLHIHLSLLYSIILGKMRKHIYSQEYTYMSQQERENTKITLFTWREVSSL